MTDGDYTRHVYVLGNMQSIGLALECMLTEHIDGHRDQELPDLIACLACEQLSKISEVRDFAANEILAELMLISAHACGANLMIKRWLDDHSDCSQNLPEAILNIIKNNNISIVSLLALLENM